MSVQKFIVENLHRWMKYGSAPPTQISISPTDICNLKCQSCWQRAESYQRWTEQDKRNIEIIDQRLLYMISEAQAMGVKCIELTGGGEPLIRKNTIAQLVKRIKRADMIGWMTTNGTLFSPELVQSMVELEWDKVTISLDGPDAETNDFLRPPAGSFEKIIRTLALFKEYKEKLNKKFPVLTFNVVVSKYNIDKLARIIELAHKYNVGGVTFEPVKILANQCKELLPDFEKNFLPIQKELQKAQEIAAAHDVFTNVDGLLGSPEVIKFSGRYLETIQKKEAVNQEHRLLNVPCIEPWFHLYLEVDGTAHPCCVGPRLGENIKEKSLKDIWFGEKFSAFRNAILNKEYPASCNQCNANLVCFSQEIQGLLREKITKESFAPAAPSFLQADLSQSGSSENSRKHKFIRMLVTDTAPLYPPLWGGPKRIWNLYSYFDPALFHITYVGVDFRMGRDTKYKFTKLRENLNEVLCAFPPHYYFWHAFEKLLFKNTSLDLFLYLMMHTDQHFSYMLNSQKADVVVCSHPWSSLCIKKTHSQVFIYDAHNCEYLLMDQILKNHPLKKAVLRQVKKIEGDACRKSNLILACSENEKKDLMDLYHISSDKIIIVTNGAHSVPLSDIPSKESSRRKLRLLGSDKTAIFVGAFYKPNNLAAQFIIEKIAPHLRDVTFLIVGTVQEAFKGASVPTNVKLLGKVSEEQLTAALSASDMAINPMFEGSGINIKMLDYMAYGLPIVATECGARGIEIAGSSPMIVAAPDNFIETIKSTFQDKKLCAQMAEAGRDLVAKQYDWRMLSSRLQDVIISRVGL